VEAKGPGLVTLRRPSRPQNCAIILEMLVAGFPSTSADASMLSVISQFEQFVLPKRGQGLRWLG
jgi:hypothetical protein